MQTQDTEIVMTRSVQVRQVFQDEHKLCVEDQPDEHGLVCCTCLESSPDLLLGECACLVCGQCWALQGAAMYCLNCKTIVNYIQMKEVIEFPAKGQMGKLFLTKEFLGSTIVSFSKFVKNQSKLQLSALKIVNKQQAAWMNKINLEKKESQKRRKEMDELEERITAKTEAIKALEEGIMRRLDVSEDSEPIREDLPIAQTSLPGLPLVTRPPGKRIRQVLPSFQSININPGLNSATQVSFVDDWFAAIDKLKKASEVPGNSKGRTDKSLVLSQVSGIEMSENLITKSHAIPIQSTTQALAPPRSLSYTQDDLVKELESQLKPLQMLPRQVGSEEQIQDKDIIMNSTNKSRNMLLHLTLPGVQYIPTISLAQSSSLSTEANISSTGSSQPRHRISEGEEESATTNNSSHPYPRNTRAVPAQSTSSPGVNDAAIDKYRVLRDGKVGTALNVVQTRGGQDCGTEGRSWKDGKRDEELRTAGGSRISPQSYTTEQQVDRPKKRRWVLASKVRRGKGPN